MRIFVVLPTYNESGNLAEMTQSLLALPFEDLHLIIVDDNSPDGTGQVADDLAVAGPERITVIHRPDKLGLGTAYAMGFQVALAQDADVIIQMDADFSHSPEYLPQMVSLLDENDVVVGSRYVPGGGTDSRWSWWRFMLSWWANQIYSRLVLGVDVQDATAGFKTFRRVVLETIDLSAVVSNGYVFQVEMAHLCQKLGFRVKEIPIYFEDRRIGRSKMDIPVKIEAVWRVWQIRWRYRKIKSLPAPVQPASE